ncbi:phenylacetic acid degradation operon negative regulatory protein PaaX [Marinobacterium sp. AK62]|uniref:Phenylacetic acid degradation operon negative regulatory protein PaaX n=1 Tax=Marinobacterium alkalitolerans TaxID=1542925 RepID=A0ABS3ZCE9_9GAMM|nr:phenylacetic acid degradation operon negative regulatory protein PaaX [Marinobacterium alkalitolerans]MBP0048689.1 phenylacetic acid degradation operon negative regulatory protein PaaX [Marinobacterium alkalitolerans]
MTKIRCIEELVEEFKEQRPIRGGSLIITIYGDAIAPRGGTVWLGSLINLLEPLGLNQRLVRTSIFRLTKDGWLTSNQIGRRSYYSLTDSGRRRFESAFRRIYAELYPEWDGKWDMILANQLDNELRKVLKKELEWQGFGNIAPSIMAHPMADTQELVNTLQELCVQNEVIHMQSELVGTQTSEALKELVHECWNLQKLAEDYQQFLDRFRPILRAIKAADDLEAEQCFQLRTLLIHHYRRLLLRDPLLPEKLLPVDWAGTSARVLCRNIYRLIYDKADEWLSQTQETADGPLPEPSPRFYKRFGGL